MCGPYSMSGWNKMSGDQTLMGQNVRGDKTSGGTIRPGTKGPFNVFLNAYSTIFIF